MKSPLRKRFLRDIRNDKGKYIALFIFVVLLVGFISGFLIADVSLKTAYDDSFEKYNVEDGHFTLSNEASDDLIDDIEAEGVEVASQYYKDLESQAGTETRVFAMRKEVNKTDLMEGEYPKETDEIALDRMFADNNDISVGDEFEADDKTYEVTGFVALSDYSTLFKNNTDMMFDSADFTVALVTSEGFDAIPDDNIRYSYTWKYDETDLSEKEKEDIADGMMEAAEDYAKTQSEEVMTEAYMKGEDPSEAVSEIATLEDFVPRESNQAIQFTGEDMGSDKNMMIALLYILMVVLAFMFAVTTKSTIEKEASSIGTLRASGYTKGELLRHYMVSPIAVTVAGALVGNILAYTVIKDYMAGLYYGSYSLPTYHTVWSSEAFWLTTVVPLIIVIVVNLITIARELSLPPLQFLRGELRKNKKAHVKKLPSKMRFLTRFRLRTIFQNMPVYIVMLVGIFLSNLILFFCLFIMPILDNFEDEVKDAELATYQYVLKAPVDTDTEGAEKYDAASLQYGSEDVLIYGIRDDSKYLDELDIENTVPYDEDADMQEVIVSDSYLEKFGYEVGDEISVKSKFGDEKYKFKVGGSFDYPASIAIFMPHETFCEVFDQDSDYFNGYFSDKELTDVKDSYISSKITSDDLTLISKQLSISFGSIMPVFAVFGILMFFIVLYLLAKVVLDRNASNISMLKILGYSNGEIGKLYSVATAIVVFVSSLISLPLCLISVRMLYHVITDMIQGWISFFIAPYIYFVVAFGAIAVYMIVYLILLRNIKKVPMSVALKNME